MCVRPLFTHLITCIRTYVVCTYVAMYIWKLLVESILLLYNLIVNCSQYKSRTSQFMYILLRVNSMPKSKLMDLSIKMKCHVVKHVSNGYICWLDWKFLFLEMFIQQMNIWSHKWLKGTIRCIQNYLSLISVYDFLGPKKTTSSMVDVRIARNKPCSWDGLILEELITPHSSFKNKHMLCG